MEALILTGACGVGKSTIAKRWAAAKDGAVVECDYFTEWIYQSSFPRWTPEEEKLVSSLAIATSHEYLKCQMPVAIENVWSPLGIQWLVEYLKHNALATSLKVVWLQCTIGENHRRDQLRIPDNQMKARVDVVNNELKAYTWPSYVKIVDSTTQSIEETLCEIEQCPPV